MSRSDEYRQIAHECIEGARTSRSAEQRKQLLELAKMWMTAASMLDHTSERPALDDYVAEPATHDRSGLSGRALSYAGDWVTRSIRRRGEPAF
jgi:hypothetical protein